MNTKDTTPAPSAADELQAVEEQIAAENADIREISNQVVALQKRQRAAIDRRNALLAKRDELAELQRQLNRKAS